MTDGSSARKYREPTPGSKLEEDIRAFREAGIDARVPVSEEGEHLLIFFGALPEEEGDEED